MPEKTPEEVWEDNEQRALDLANTYYLSYWKEMKDQGEKDTRENVGYNAFADGIRCGLDIVLPLLDAEKQKEVNTKIKSMITRRKEAEKNNILQVKCSFCKSDMECPEDMKDSKKHMCPDCFHKKKYAGEEDLEKVHIDVPNRS